MLSTGLSTGAQYIVLAITALLFICCAALVFWMLQLANYCRAAVEYVTNDNKNAVSLRRIAEMEATLTELSDAYDALLASHKKLRSRIGMRANRQRAKSEQELPSAPQTDVERAEYKARLRESAKQRGLLR